MRTLRHDITSTLNQLRAVEITKAEIAIDIAARRAQIADLESRLSQETGECIALREENKRLRQQLKRAELEREILKKATAYFAKESL